MREFIKDNDVRRGNARFISEFNVAREHGEETFLSRLDRLEELKADRADRKKKKKKNVVTKIKHDLDEIVCPGSGVRP